MINQTTIIGIIVFVLIVFAAAGGYSLIRPDNVLDRESAVAPPEGPPGFPTPSFDTSDGTTPSRTTPTDSVLGSDVDFLGTPTRQTPTAPISGEQTVKRETLVIDTTSGPVEINNVLLNPQEVLQGGWGVVMQRTLQYTLIYYEPDEAFRIVINDPDVQPARDAAEWEFLQEVGIAPGDACKLDVSLVVTGDVNLDLAGVNYGLSFCPGGKAFPL